MNSPAAHTDALLGWLDRRRRWLWLGIALLLLIGFNGQWRVGPDSAIHVTAARNLAEGAGLTHPTGLENTIRPGLAYVTAATFQLFGVDRFVAIDALMLLCAAGVLVLTYWTMRLRLDRRTAMLIVCMLAVNETFYRYGYQVLTDMPFMLGLMLLLLAVEGWRRGGHRRIVSVMLIVLAIAIMAAFRSVALVVLAAGWLALVYQGCADRKHRAIYLTTAGIVAIGAAAAGFFMGGASWLRDTDKAMDLVGGDLGGTLARVFTDNAPVLFAEHLPEAMFGVDLGPWIGAPLGVIAVLMALALFKVRPLWGLLVGVFLLQWMLLITTGRYPLVIMPLLALGWWRLMLWCESRCRPGHARVLIAGLMVLWFVPNLVMIGAFIVEQRARPFMASYEDGRYTALWAVADELVDIAEDGDMIIADNAPQLTWYTRLPVYDPSTMPAFGRVRRQTIRRLYFADRILLIAPAGDTLNERIDQFQLKQAEVLRHVNTAGYDRIDSYQIIRLRTRETNGKSTHRDPRLEGHPGDAQEADRQTKEQTRQAEEPGDQSR